MYIAFCIKGEYNEPQITDNIIMWGETMVKRKYVEPVLLAEDFTVSEMVAANCELQESDITVVQQMSHTGCAGTYDDTWLDVAYGRFSDLYEGNRDVDGNGTLDACFTAAYAGISPGSDVCSFRPFDQGIYFGLGIWSCSGDSSLVQNS